MLKDYLNMELPTTAVYLTEEECEQFVAFQKHRALIGLLSSVGAFKMINGSVTIHFGALNNIVAVEKHEHFKA